MGQRQPQVKHRELFVAELHAEPPPADDIENTANDAYNEEFLHMLASESVCTDCFDRAPYYAARYQVNEPPFDAVIEFVEGAPLLVLSNISLRLAVSVR